MNPQKKFRVRLASGSLGDCWVEERVVYPGRWMHAKQGKEYTEPFQGPPEVYYLRVGEGKII